MFYIDEKGAYYLNISGSQEDWDKFLIVTYKPEQYLLYDSKFYSSG